MINGRSRELVVRDCLRLENSRVLNYLFLCGKPQGEKGWLVLVMVDRHYGIVVARYWLAATDNIGNMGLP